MVLERIVVRDRVYVFMGIQSNGRDRVKIITDFNKCNDGSNTDLRE